MEGGLRVVDGLLRHALAEEQRVQRVLRLPRAAEEHALHSEGVEEARRVAAVERRPQPGRRRAHRACVQLRPAG